MTNTPQPRPRGRPRKPGGATTDRERRDDLKQRGGQWISIGLEPPAAAALAALRAAHGTSIPDAVSDALLRAAASLGGPA